MNIEPLTESVLLPVSQEQAFTLFTKWFARWWPREFSWSGIEELQDIGMECSHGGALFEIGSHGLRWDWGRVLLWEPYTSLVFSWQIGPDRVPVPTAEASSEVVVTFQAQAGGGTLVAVVHQHWERHGEAGQAYREMFAYAWGLALQRLEGACAASSRSEGETP